MPKPRQRVCLDSGLKLDLNANLAKTWLTLAGDLEDLDVQLNAEPEKKADPHLPNLQRDLFDKSPTMLSSPMAPRRRMNEGGLSCVEA
jgi:hypothetical protein